jgi:hypothetical protein
MKGRTKMETKEWYKSKTIWSAIIIAIVGTLNVAFGFLPRNMSLFNTDLPI